MNKLSCYYFPTTVALIDDNPVFLRNTKLALNLRNISCITYENPHNFLDFIDNGYKPNSFLKNCFAWLEEDDFDHRTVDLNISTIHQQVYNQNRFQEISVIVADYAMPDMNGLEMLNKITTPNIKKILITGEADEKLAVTAFNNKSIDAFIIKKSTNLAEEIICKIRDLQQQYFLSATEFALNCIVNDPTRSSCLNDPVFIDHFSTLYNANKFTEYYLLEESGSFLLLDINGNPSWLAVKTDKDIQHYCDLIAHTDNNEEMPKDILEFLQNRKKILFFHTDQDLQSPIPQWHKYLHDAELLLGKTNYYVTLIINSPLYKLDTAKILPYQKFLNKPF